MLSDGFTIGEIATHFERSESWVSARLQELREAIVRQALDRDDLAPPLRARLERELRGPIVPDAGGGTTATPPAGRRSLRRATGAGAS